MVTGRYRFRQVLVLDLESESSCGLKQRAELRAGLQTIRQEALCGGDLYRAGRAGNQWLQVCRVCVGELGVGVAGQAKQRE